MITKLLIATDLSEASDKIIGCMPGWRGAGAHEALLVHCVNVRNVGGITDSLRESLQPKLDEEKRLLEKQGFTVEVQLVEGLPQFEINRLAKEHDCDMIVAGSLGSTMLKELLLGGVVTNVLHNAVKPVLVVRLEVVEEDEGKYCMSLCAHPAERILFPTDFSDTARHAFKYVERFAEQGAKHVSLLHVQERARIERHLSHKVEEFNRIDQERLDDLKQRLKSHGDVSVDTKVQYGSPVDEIMKAAEEFHDTLIVMGTQGRSFFSEFLLGSVSHHVARHAPASVLLVPLKTR